MLHFFEISIVRLSLSFFCSATLFFKPTERKQNHDCDCNINIALAQIISATKTRCIQEAPVPQNSKREREVNSLIAN
jgi:hypothetical protein